MRRTAAALSLTTALMLAPAAPAFAEVPTSRSVTAVSAPTPSPSISQPDTPKPEKSSGGWGLWGLLGLLGLLGLIPRKKKTGNAQPVRGTAPAPGRGAHPTDRDPNRDQGL